MPPFKEVPLLSKDASNGKNGSSILSTFLTKGEIRYAWNMENKSLIDYNMWCFWLIRPIEFFDSFGLENIYIF